MKSRLKYAAAIRKRYPLPSGGEYHDTTPETLPDAAREDLSQPEDPPKLSGKRAVAQTRLAL